MIRRRELALELKDVFLSEIRQVPDRHTPYDHFYVKQNKRHSRKMIRVVYGAT